MATLHAWATDAWFNGNLVDHTWVTTYDNRTTPYPDIPDVQNHGEHYWFSWGDFHEVGEGHADGSGALGSAAADIGMAICIALPDVETRTDPRAQGTIHRYGIDGVCHQLSNQVLAATTGFVGGGTPLTVSKARGYWLSTFMYGTYGVDQAAWRAKLASCQTIGTTMPIPPSHDDEADEFQQHARRVLGDDEKTLRALLDLRRTALHAGTAAGVETPGTAEDINARNQRFFDQAAQLLGRERYVALFGVEPEQRVGLVDPKMLGQAATR